MIEFFKKNLTDGNLATKLIEKF